MGDFETFWNDNLQTYYFYFQISTSTLEDLNKLSNDQKIFLFDKALGDPSIADVFKSAETKNTSLNISPEQFKIIRNDSNNLLSTISNNFKTLILSGDVKLYDESPEEFLNTDQIIRSSTVYPVGELLTDILNNIYSKTLSNTNLSNQALTKSTTAINDSSQAILTANQALTKSSINGVKLTNIDDDGNLIDDDYDPDTTPKKPASQKNIKDNQTVGFPISVKDFNGIKALKEIKTINATLNTNVGWNTVLLGTKEELFKFNESGTDYITDKVRVKLYNYSANNATRYNNADSIIVEISPKEFLTTEKVQYGDYFVRDRGADEGAYQYDIRFGFSVVGDGLHMNFLVSGVSSGDAYINTLDIDLSVLKLNGTVGLQGPRGAKGQKGEQGPIGPKGDPAPADARVLLCDETINIPSRGSGYFQMKESAIIQDFKNIEIFLTPPLTPTYAISKFISDTSIYQNQDLFLYSFKSFFFDLDPTEYSFLEFNFQNFWMYVYNETNNDLDYTLKITGERITTTKKITDERIKPTPKIKGVK